jgi:hypothetical protein
MRRVPAATVTVEKQQVSHILCVCVCVALGFHETYCHLWPVRLQNIFTYYLTNGTIFERKKIESKMGVLIILTIFV